MFKNHPRRRVSRNVNLSNLGNGLQRNLRTNRPRECNFRASGVTNFEKFATRRQPWWCLRGFNVCIGLPKKTLHTLLISCNIFLLAIKLPHNQLWTIFEGRASITRCLSLLFC